jgi:Zn-dependent protease with chaperone function
MNFFEHQDTARKKTTRLLVLFGVMVFAIISIIYLVIAAGLQQAEGVGVGWWQPQIFLAVAGILLVIILGGAAVKTSGLKAGGGAVAEALGGRLISRQARDARERQLMNVVEEMAIASGVPVPLVFVLDQEEGINAFAAGHTPDDAAVAVTRGALNQFNRDELQGVIAHEFSHILNGDMRLNIRLMGLLGGILAMATIGRIIMYSSSRSRKKEGQGFALVGLALFIIGYLGVVAGKIIQAAMSRQREYLADASAVQFTRNPSGIGGALKKIQDHAEGSSVQSGAAAEASHMFFGPISFSSIFATHPPLAARIQRIQEGGVLISDVSTAKTRSTTPAGKATKKGTGSSFPGVPDGMMGAGVMVGSAILAEEAARTASSDSSSSSASPDAARTKDSAAGVLALIPESLQNAVSSSLGASAAVCALLLDADANARHHQFDLLNRVAPLEFVREVSLLVNPVLALSREARLPLADIAVPALRQMSATQATSLVEVMKALILADDEVTLFEFCLYNVVARRMQHVAGVKKAEGTSRGTWPTGKAETDLVAALCRFGTPDPDQAVRAFGEARRVLDGLPDAGIAMQTTVAVQDLNAAMDHLASRPLKHRQKVLDACVLCIQFDGQVTVEEAEMLRAVAAALDLPMPSGF